MILRFPRKETMVFLLQDGAIVRVEATENLKAKYWEVQIEMTRRPNEEEDEWIQESVKERLKERDLRDYGELLGTDSI